VETTTPGKTLTVLINSLDKLNKLFTGKVGETDLSEEIPLGTQELETNRSHQSHPYATRRKVHRPTGTENLV